MHVSTRMDVNINTGTIVHMNVAIIPVLIV
jgi:hypothetical protein